MSDDTMRELERLIQNEIDARILVDDHLQWMNANGYSLTTMANNTGLTIAQVRYRVYGRKRRRPR